MKRLMAVTMAGIMAALAAVAQPVQPERKPAPPKITKEETVFSDYGLLVQRMMDSELPYRDGQKLFYRDENKMPYGFAIRQRLTIRFYDRNGEYAGRAQRRQNNMTFYYDKDGNFLGTRVDTKLTAKKKETEVAAPDPIRAEALKRTAEKYE